MRAFFHEYSSPTEVGVALWEAKSVTDEGNTFGSLVRRTLFSSETLILISEPPIREKALYSNRYQEIIGIVS